MICRCLRVKVVWRVVARTTPLVVGVGVGIWPSLIVIQIETPILISLVVVPPLIVVSSLEIGSTMRVVSTQVVVVRPR